MLFSPFSGFSFLAHEFAFLQHWCLSSVPVQRASHSVWQAMVCAKPLSNANELKIGLQITGLIHLFVVSGSHFIVLQFVLEKFRIPRFLQFFILWIYNGVTGFSAPGTRACLNLTCGDLFRVRRDQSLLAVSFLCLAIQPRWALSYSFWLSWLASLILILCPQFKIDWLRNTVFFSIWSLLGFSMSVFSILYNLILGPLITWVLFPLAFLSYLPGFPWLFHWSLEILKIPLNWIQSEDMVTQFPIYLAQLSGLVLLTHGFLQLRFLQRKGQKIR